MGLSVPGVPKCHGLDRHGGTHADCARYRRSKTLSALYRLSYSVWSSRKAPLRVTDWAEAYVPDAKPNVGAVRSIV